MKRLVYLLLSITILMITTNCQEEEINTPVSLANITAVISGAINLEYSGSGIVTTSNVSNALVLNLGTSTKKDNKLYMLGIFILYKDFTEKIGTFKFASQDGVFPGDFAIGTFDISEGNNKKQFISDSGTVEITELHGRTVRGTFYFRAKEKTTGEVVEVKNGIISFQ